VDLAINNDKRRTTMATVTNTNQPVIKVGNGIGGRTTIVNLALTNMTNANVDTVLKAIAYDGFTIAGVSCLTESGVFTSGTTDNIQIAVQGTDTFVADGSDAYGVTGAVTSVLAIYA
jgi:hypothetical protein